MLTTLELNFDEMVLSSLPRPLGHFPVQAERFSLLLNYLAAQLLRPEPVVSRLINVCVKSDPRRHPQE